MTTELPIASMRKFIELICSALVTLKPDSLFFKSATNQSFKDVGKQQQCLWPNATHLLLQTDYQLTQGPL